MSYRGPSNSDSKRYFDWLFHASLDYLSAKQLIKDERCYFATAFHCQQCIEKALKSFMLFKKRKLFDGHNLTWLCKQAIMMDEHFRAYLLPSATLNKYYIETRYPADIPLDIDVDTIQRLFDMTGDMLNFICEQIRFDFASYHKKRK
ncbi:MAG: HEPN domain-containing protein [Oscillospiraceae bacterium]|jgi:HEPN domain-containing protein